MKLVDFGFVALLWSYMYGMIYVAHFHGCVFAVRSPSKSKLPTMDYFSTWQFHLYYKADNELS